MRHLPRFFGCVAFVALATLALSATAHAQRGLDSRVEDGPAAQRPDAGRPPVEPGTATSRAFLFPGGGHFYSGERGRGGALLGVAAGSLIAGALLSSGGGPCGNDGPGGDRCEYNHETHESREPADRTPLWIGAGVAAATWAYGIIDASSSADRVNAKNGFALGPLNAQPQPLLEPARGREPVLGLQLRVSW